MAGKLPANKAVQGDCETVHLNDIYVHTNFTLDNSSLHSWDLSH